MTARKQKETAAEVKTEAIAAAPEGTEAEKPARLTRFKSHGLGYYRVTVPRWFGERFCSDLNLFSTSINAETGVITLTPIRPLIANTAPLYAVAEAEAEAPEAEGTEQ